jgi:hypothetical protein
MAKINTDTILLDMLGEKIETPVAPGQPPEPLTLKTVLIQCLINEADGEKNDAKAKLDRYDLALKIKDGGEIEMQSGEIEMCKKSIAKQFPVLVVGQADKLLEGKPTGLEKKEKK